MELTTKILSLLYDLMVIFVIAYPLVTSVMWESFSLFYKFHWEDHSVGTYKTHLPFVSIVVPAYNEASGIRKNIDTLLNLSYDDYELMVVNDGSKDDTLKACLPYLDHPRFRLLHKEKNEGKAMALNDAIPCLKGDIIVTVDADSEAEPDFLHHLVWHFRFPNVGAVTGHPRVRNTVNLLTRIQIIEFASIIGLLRRAQSIWGRLMTVSGILAAYRRETLLDVNGFHPDMYTEDIDITWRIQKNGWKVHYEPRSIIWMEVPSALGEFLKQRLRWARGLMQVLKRHVNVIRRWKYRYMWAIYVESCLSTTWCLIYGVIFTVETYHFVKGAMDGDIHFFPLQWTLVLFTATLMQLLWGIIMEQVYDRGVIRYAPYAIFYPLFYWSFMVLVTLAALPVFVLKSGIKVVWSSRR